MINKLIKKYQAYKDKKFLARLERVLNSNVVKSNIALSGHAFIKGDFWIRISKCELEDISKGVPLDVALSHLHRQVDYQQDNLQSD